MQAAGVHRLAISTRQAASQLAASSPWLLPGCCRRRAHPAACRTRRPGSGWSTWPTGGRACRSSGQRSLQKKAGSTRVERVRRGARCTGPVCKAGSGCAAGATHTTPQQTEAVLAQKELACRASGGRMCWAPAPPLLCTPRSALTADHTTGSACEDVHQTEDGSHGTCHHGVQPELVVQLRSTRGSTGQAQVCWARSVNYHCKRGH